MPDSAHSSHLSALVGGQLIAQKLLHSRIMDKGNKQQTPPVDNSVSDSTGQYDLRFVLWRQFCAKYSIPVDTLPSQLDDEQKDKWEEMKAKRLK
jgi:hypothetical protein